MLFTSETRTYQCRTRNLLVASVAIALLFGVIVLPSDGGSSPFAHPLKAQLIAATRVAQTSDGDGYWLVDARGRVFAFGGATLYGSMAGRRLTAPITGIVATADNHGYWLVAADGGVFGFGDAKFSDSLGSKSLTSPIVGMASGSHTAMGGARGPAGPSGPSGPLGPLGPRGLTGAAGSNGNAGATGSTGAAGTNGSAGTNGTNGSAGSPGPTGPTGSAGTNGTNGATGSTGAAGPTGSPGVGSLVNHAAVYSTTAQTIAVESAIGFNNDGPLTGFTHGTGTTQIVATVVGVYRVEFFVSAVEPNQFALFVNGVVVPNSTNGSGAGTQQNIGVVDVALGAGDILELVNHSSAAAITLQTVAGGTQTNVNASIHIQQIA